MVVYILSTILGITIITSVVIIANLFAQINKLNVMLEEYANRINETEQNTIKYYRYFLELFTQTYVELQRIDKKGSFSSDDEVGFSFNVIISAIETVKEKLSQLEIEGEIESGKK